MQTPPPCRRSSAAHRALRSPPGRPRVPTTTPRVPPSASPPCRRPGGASWGRWGGEAKAGTERHTWLAARAAHAAGAATPALAQPRRRRRRRGPVRRGWHHQAALVSFFRSAEQGPDVRFRAGRRLSTCTHRPETRMNPGDRLLIVNRSAENGERKWAASRPSAASSGRRGQQANRRFPRVRAKKNPNRMRVGISHYGGGA